MTRFHFERPDGNSKTAQTILIHLNEFVPPQGFGGGIVVGIDEMGYEDLVSNGYEVVWFNTDWLQRIPLNINVGQVPSVQNNFPLLINDTYTDLIGAVEAELRFTGEDNIQLPYEIESFDNLTGELVAWIKKPTVSDGDILYIYFDSFGASDEQNKTAVWDENYTSVYHLGDDVLDSTDFANDMTDFSTTIVPGMINSGREFAGNTGSYTIINPYSGFPTSEITCEYWVKSIGTNDGMVSYGTGSSGDANVFLTIRQNDFLTTINNIGFTSGISINDGNFHHVVVTWKATDSNTKMYIDGVLLTTTVSTPSNLADGGALVLGQDQDSLGGGFNSNQSLDGILDEVRISNIVRSADYITTSFNNQNNPGAFYATDPVQLVSEIASTSMGYES